MNDLHRNSRPCSRPPKSGEASPSGFTLIELLVVVSIMILVYGFVAPAMTSSQEKNSLYLAGQMVADELVVARQYAASRNQTVQVRFITLTSFAQAVTPNRTGYNGIQLWQTTVTGTSAIDQINRLPDGTEISSKSALSPLVAYTGTDALATGTGSPPYPLAGSQAGSYVSFNIRPDGNVQVPTPPVDGGGANANGATPNGAFISQPSYFLTIQPSRFDSNITLPVNYLTILVNPDTGRTEIFRP